MNLANWLKLITLASLSSANIVELFDTSFLDSIQSDTWFVGYFIDWSPHSRAIARSWEELSTELTQWSKDNSFNFASLNCEKNEELCKRHNIYGYPTFKIYKNGKFIEEYNGYPDINKLENYAKERAQRLEAIPETKHVAQAQAELVNDSTAVQVGTPKLEELEA
ncbi:thioredoxin-like protein, partial [Conidiobolus coronatus NRRL 28638]